MRRDSGRQTLCGQPTLLESDVRSIVSLISGIAGKSTEHPVLIGFLLHGLCLLIDAEKWLWIRRAPGESKRRPFDSAFLHGGFSESELEDISASFIHPTSDIFDEFFRSQQIQAGRHLTLRLEDYSEHEIWRNTPSGVLASSARTGSFIRSLSPLDEAGTRCVISLFRAPGAPPFTDREVRIAHFALSEIAWLHEPCWPENHHLKDTEALSQRLFPIFKLLVAGSSRLQISDELQLTVNTVNSYTKEIYRHYGVHSQTELMRAVALTRTGPPSELPTS